MTTQPTHLRTQPTHLPTQRTHLPTEPTYPLTHPPQTAWNNCKNLHTAHPQQSFPDGGISLSPPPEGSHVGKPAASHEYRLELFSCELRLVSLRRCNTPRVSGSTLETRC